MEILYSPWRNKYVKEVARAKEEHIEASDCIFCQQFTQDDEKHFLLRRFKTMLVMLNLYPYNAGHLLILPLAHKNSLQELSSDEKSELIELTSASVEILKEVLKAEGINVGLNLGKIAGAGIPSHLHMHVLPRWLGDTNFLPTLTGTKQVSTDLREIYKQLKPRFNNIVL